MFLQMMSEIPEGVMQALIGGGVAGLASMIMGALVIVAVVSLALYVYTSLAWFTIAKKLKYNKPWIAWIPIANYFLLPILSGYSWVWGFIILSPLIVVIPILGWIISPLTLIFITVMSTIWTWKIFVKRKFPGWLSLIPLLNIIPIIGTIASIAFLVILGIVAWYK